MVAPTLAPSTDGGDCYEGMYGNVNRAIDAYKAVQCEAGGETRGRGKDVKCNKQKKNEARKVRKQLRALARPFKNEETTMAFLDGL